MQTPTITGSQELMTFAVTGKISWDLLDELANVELSGKCFDIPKLIAEAQSGILTVSSAMNFIVDAAIKNGESVTVTSETSDKTTNYDYTKSVGGTLMEKETTIKNITTKTANII